MPVAEPIAVERIVIKRPSIFTVCVLNDDVTALEFVVAVLMAVFGMSQETAFATAYDIHENGKASIGEFTREVAEMKAQKIMTHAQEVNFPLVAFPKELS